MHRGVFLNARTNSANVCRGVSRSPHIYKYSNCEQDVLCKEVTPKSVLLFSSLSSTIPGLLPALSRKSLFDAKDEARKQAAAADKAREVAVEEAVARIQRQMEESMSEVYR